VLAVAPKGAVFEDVLRLLRRLRDDYDAELLVMSDAEEALALGQRAARLPAGLPEWLVPIMAIVPAQLYCYHLTRAKGHDPDAPRNIRKVTLTR
jgi:glucosamine--fructose-6-phosphate aminotransferase (isomerizing)